MAETQTKYVEGAWPEHCEQRAFVAGAKWWEFASTGGTMWASDRDKAEAEAVRRYGPPIPETRAEELRELRRDAARWRAIAEQAYIASIGPLGPYYISTIDRQFPVCPGVAEFADALIASRSSSATSPDLGITSEGYAVRECRGHFHVTIGGQDLAIEGDPFPTRDAAQAALEREQAASATSPETTQENPNHG